jgi:heat shock protein 4
MRKSNYKNIVTAVKRFIGRKWSETQVQHDLKECTCRTQRLENDEIGFVVNFGGEDKVFTPTQIMAMQLANVQDFTAAYTEKAAGDVVISVPSFFTDAQRRAMLAAAEIAGINCLRLFNETTASALNYGIYKSQKGIFDEEKPQYVMFCDMGHASFQVSIVAFQKGKMEVKATTFDRDLGGRDWDRVIAERLNEEFMEKKGQDLRGVPKSWIKLTEAAEKAKKTLSPNGVTMARVHLECLYKEHDFSTKLVR